MIKKKEVKQSLIDKRIREAIDAGANEAVSQLVAIKGEEIEKQNKKWVQGLGIGFGIGVAATAVGTVVGTGIGLAIAENRIERGE